jgi:hypothetical protein
MVFIPGINNTLIPVGERGDAIVEPELAASRQQADRQQQR